MAVNCRHMFGQIKPPQHRRKSRRFEPTPTVEPTQNFKKPKVTENKTHTELPSNTTQQSICSRPGPAHLYNLRWWRSQLKTIASSGPRHLLWNTNQDLKDLVPDLVWTEFEVFCSFQTHLSWTWTLTQGKMQRNETPDTDYWPSVHVHEGGVS